MNKWFLLICLLNCTNGLPIFEAFFGSETRNAKDFRSDKGKILSSYLRPIWFFPGIQDGLQAAIISSTTESSLVKSGTTESSLVKSGTTESSTTLSSTTSASTSSSGVPQGGYFF